MKLQHTLRAFRGVLLASALALATTACGTGDVSVEGPDVTADVGGGGDTSGGGGGGGKDTAGSKDTSGGDTGGGVACVADFDCTVSIEETSCSKPRCIGGVCKAAVQPKGTPCELDGLEPGPCQVSVCDGVGKCTFAGAPEGLPCGDGPCGDVCQGGQCVQGGGKDDGDPCTLDVCEGGQVQHLPLTDPSVDCDDGNPCTASAGCLGGNCVGKPLVCDDGIDCTIDFCAGGKGCDTIVADGLCDDGNPCTSSACLPDQGGCVHKAEAGKACDDDNACSADETCDANGVCGKGKNICQCKTADDCNGGNLCLQFVCEQGVCLATPGIDPCTGKDDSFCGAYFCDPATGGCAFKPLKEGQPCDDGDACTSASQCAGGKCAPSAKAVCDDGNPCTVDGCDSKVGCVSKPADGQTCNDGNACTQKDTCKNGGCYGVQQNCNDGDACTVDSCAPDSGKCAHKPIPGCGGCKSDAECNDGDPCTKDACIVNDNGSGGICTATKIPNCGVTCDSDTACDDNDPCTKDGCSIDAAGQLLCTHVPLQDPNCQPGCKSPADCPQPGAICMEATCINGACGVALTPGCVIGCKSDAECEDGNKCTINVCTVQGTIGTCQSKTLPDCGGCTSDAQCPAPGGLCSVAYCEAGVCKIKQDPACATCKSDLDCDDGDKCTKDACLANSAGSTGCIHEPIPGCGTTGCAGDAACDDGNACTTDACVAGKCVFKPKSCDDGNACTIDACTAGKCLYSSKVCNDGDACTQDACDPKSGQCLAAPILNCGNKCTSSQQCQDNNPCVYSYCSQGTCTAQPKTCNDNNACTFDSCNLQNGACVYTPIPGCDNSCKQTSDCDDSNPCTYDTCSAFQGKCYNQTIPNCDPTKPKCKSAADCDDGKPCTTDSCSTFSGNCSHYNVPNCVIGLPCKTAAECNDKNGCTTDVCEAGKCAPKSISCDDFNPCTNDYCQTSNGKCVHTQKPGCVAEACKADSECQDGNSCTKDLCLFGYCQHLLDPACN